MKLLAQPVKILFVALLLGALGLVGTGSFGNIYNLVQTRHKMQAQLQSVRFESEELQRQIRLAKDPLFLESQAVDRFDLAEESDLVFVFSEF